jgi:U6 snRNA-associated Sm-like protein LSm7
MDTSPDTATPVQAADTTSTSKAVVAPEGKTTKPYKKKRKNLVNLNEYLEQQVMVKFVGGRTVQGVLKGYDQLMNLVLDDAKENVRDPNDPYKSTDTTRALGLIVGRGTAVTLVSPATGMKEVANPFLQEAALKAQSIAE